MAPESKAVIRENWARWDVEMDRLLTHSRVWLNPVQGKLLASYHRSWVYFFQQFGFELAGEIETKPGISPSARLLVKVAKTFREKGVQLLLMEPWYSETRLGDFVTASGVTLIKKSSMSSGEGYLVWMRGLVEAVAEVYGLPEPLLESRDSIQIQ